MCRNSVANVVEIEKESISTTVMTLLQHVYDHMETRLKSRSACNVASSLIIAKP